MYFLTLFICNCDRSLGSGGGTDGRAAGGTLSLPRRGCWGQPAWGTAWGQPGTLPGTATRAAAPGPWRWEALQDELLLYCFTLSKALQLMSLSLLPSVLAFSFFFFPPFSQLLWQEAVDVFIPPNKYLRVWSFVKELSWFLTPAAVGVNGSETRELGAWNSSFGGLPAHAAWCWQFRKSFPGCLHAF